MTILVCTLTLSACVDEACNLVGPSETAGSHETGADETTLFALVRYDRQESVTRNLAGPGSAIITVGGKGPFSLLYDQSTTTTLPNIRKNQAVPVRADGRLLGTCTWTGTTKLLTVDVIVSVHGQLDGSFQLGCGGWDR